ncbi:cytochrome P450 [Mycolicibacterium sp.]|uniref:cytochrome P450 n=1 Tax=Mycolicibacterium sp. TaxID=2320850 RepID=UPI0028A7A7D6|nr:cytochrome P450 [Mycolicibacterium sp.]
MSNSGASPPSPSSPSSPLVPHGFDFLDPDRNVERLPVDELAELRRVAPVWWCEQQIGKGGFNDGGYWVVTKHKDVKEVSRRSDVYHAGPNTALPQFADEMKREDIDMQRVILLNMDGEHHDRLRRIISRGFTPRAIERLRADLSHRAEAIVKKAAAEGYGDFVEQVSCELPLQVIAGLLGVPQDDREKLFRWSNEMTGNEDPEFAHIDARASSMEVLAYAMQMAALKATDPGEDIVTALINADIDGEKLADDEFAFFVLMLAVAGNETTRNSITHGMIAFANHPEQWEIYKKQRPATAADEIVRWATPVTAFQRTAVTDTELSGVPIKAGQRVVMFYRSANFDEEVFDRPNTFNILRDPNPHVGFGGTGVHYCIGANLARMTIDLIFNAIADYMPDLSPIGTPERLRSGWLNGIKHWQVDYTGSSAS